VRFWLTHNHPRYANKLEISGNVSHTVEKLTPELSKLLRRAIKYGLPNKNYGLKKIEEGQPDETGEDGQER
jgi:hypothetical protein